MIYGLGEKVNRRVWTSKTPIEEPAHPRQVLPSMVPFVPWGDKWHYLSTTILLVSRYRPETRE